MRLTIRARLTLWFTALVGGLLLVFCAGVVAVQGRLSRSQFDVELDKIAQTAVRVMREQLADHHDMERAAVETRKAVNVPGRATAILDERGRTLAAHWRSFAAAAVPRLPGAEWTGTVSYNGRLWRVHIAPVEESGAKFLVVSAAPLSEIERERRLLQRALGVSAPAALLLAAAFCWWTASRALLPLTAMAAQAEAITPQAPDRRITAASGGDEIGQLARAFNRLLDRLAAALRTERQFMADASHELRTPVSVARTAAEVTLAASRGEAEYREALTVVRDQTARLGRMVDDMLVLARADAEGFPVRVGRVYLDDAVNECVGTFATFATQRGVALECSAEADVLASADDSLVRQLLTNLIDNALKYTPRGGCIAVTLSVEGHDAVLAVADNGSGVPVNERERIFERFVRLSDGRDKAEGAGLGLPIARWIAEAHGGSLVLDGTASAGCRFVARLPVVVRRTITAPAVPADRLATSEVREPARHSVRARPV